MATFNDYLNDYKTATAKESAAERAKRIQQELARAKKLKFAARNEQQKEAELNAFLNASTAASELLRVIGGIQRGSVSQKEAEAVFQTYQNTVQVLRKLNPEKHLLLIKYLRSLQHQRLRENLVLSTTQVVAQKKTYSCKTASHLLVPTTTVSTKMELILA